MRFVSIYSAHATAKAVGLSLSFHCGAGVRARGSPIGVWSGQIRIEAGLCLSSFPLSLSLSSCSHSITCAEK